MFGRDSATAARLVSAVLVAMTFAAGLRPLAGSGFARPRHSPRANRSAAPAQSAVRNSVLVVVRFVVDMKESLWIPSDG